MLKILLMLLAGILLGLMLRNKKRLLKPIAPLTSWSIYLLLFLLGLSVGTNEAIISNLNTIGLKALLLTLGSVTGSVLAASFTYRLFFKMK